MDLTKITTPFGLLDEATQKALRECGGPWEIYSSPEGWTGCDPSWGRMYAYRLKPQPPKPREWWVVTNNPDDDAWLAVPFKPSATQWRRVVHVREVIE